MMIFKFLTPILLRILFLVLFSAFTTIKANAAGFTPIAIATIFVEKGFENGEEIEGPAQEICLAGGRPSYDCPSYITLGQGVCLSGGRPSYDCSSYTTLGQGICLSTGRPSFDCNSYTSTASGLCLAKGHPTFKCNNISAREALALEIIDLSWAWDQFYNSSGNTVWACRGKSTGQFADSYRCSNRLKRDDTWPGKRN